MLWRHFRREVTHCELFETKQARLSAARDFFERSNQCPENILSVIGSNAQIVSRLDLGITKRNKKRFEAARLLMLLGTLAHNLLVWSRRWLMRWSDPKGVSRLQHCGMKRLVRDLYPISGTLWFDRKGRLYEIALSPSSSLANLIRAPLHHLLAPSQYCREFGRNSGKLLRCEIPR